MIRKVFRGSRNPQPGRVLFQGGEKALEPAVLVAMGVRAGPDTKFFHVIARGGQTAGMQGRSVAQVGDDLLDFSKRDQITERLLSGKNPNALAAIFGDVSAKKLL